MNEEEKNQNAAQENKNALDDKKKNALLRYITILFAVAFLFVLFSMLLQMRDSQTTISELNKSSASALQNAEQLQENNRLLQESNEALQEEIDALNAQLEELQAEQPAEDQTALIAQLEQEVETAKGKTQEAYEQLLLAMELQTPGSQEGNVAFSKALDNLESLKEYLGETGRSVYNRLLQQEEGE